MFFTDYKGGKGRRSPEFLSGKGWIIWDCGDTRTLKSQEGRVTSMSLRCIYQVPSFVSSRLKFVLEPWPKSFSLW